MTRVFRDTNLFVDLLEGGQVAGQVRDLRRRMLERRDQLVTSALTLGELLVRPARENPATFDDHRRTLRQIATILIFDADAAPIYAQIRTDRSIGAPDAVQPHSITRSVVEDGNNWKYVITKPQGGNAEYGPLPTEFLGFVRPASRGNVTR